MAFFPLSPWSENSYRMYNYGSAELDDNHNPENQNIGEMFQILYSNWTVIWIPDHVLDAKRKTFSVSHIKRVVKNVCFTVQI